MYSFFVLGQIPGTNIVITFSMWMLLVAAVANLSLLFVLVHHRRIQELLQTNHDNSVLESLAI